MASLSWIAVLLTFSLSVGNNLALDQNYLRESVQRIIEAYKTPDVQASFAVNIPENKEKLGDVFKTDISYIVTKAYMGGEIYKGTYVVAAKFLKDQKSGLTFTEHAEARVLDNIEGLAQRRKDHILILYSSLSPCGTKCTNLDKKRFNILERIKKNVKPKWTDYAFVFSTVFDQISAGKRIPLEEIKQALANLAGAIGENNVYRCYQPWSNDFKCIKCYNNGVVEPECIQN